MTTETISPDLRTVLRRLKLSPILDTLPERLTLCCVARPVTRLVAFEMAHRG